MSAVFDAKKRAVFVSGIIEDQMAELITAQLLFLEAEDPGKGIAMYINSPGGRVTAGLALYDTMRFLRPPISTCCTGQAAAMASLLLCAGRAGMRRSLPNALITVQQAYVARRPLPPSLVALQDAAFQRRKRERDAEALVKTNRRIWEIYAKHTGRPIECIECRSMTPEQAKASGFIDEIAAVKAAAIHSGQAS